MDGTPIWAGAATHDVAIEIAKRGHLINHRIDPEVDAERDFIGANLTDTSSVSRQEYLHGVDPVFQAQTSSGEAYHSDSRILLLDLQRIASAKIGLPSSIRHRCSGDLAAYRRSDRVFSEQLDIAPLSQVIHKVASTTTLVSSLHASRIIKDFCIGRVRC